MPPQASALGLPHDTPLIMRVSSDPAALAETRKKSPLEESRSAPAPAPTFPIPKHESDLVRFVTMPQDHLIYAGTWAALCVALGLMARHVIVKPARMLRLVGTQRAQDVYNK